MRLTGEPCSACGGYTVYTVSFLGMDGRTIGVPCCDSCQDGGRLTEDLRIVLTAAARDRASSCAAAALLPMN